MLCPLLSGRQTGMTATKGKYVKHKKSAAVVIGALLAVGMATPAFADDGVTGYSVGSPGVLSGNVFQIPIGIPVNACGTSVSLVGLLNPTADNACVN